MLKTNRKITAYSLIALALAAVIPASALVVSDVRLPGTMEERLNSPQTLSEANYGEPVCFSQVSGNYDGVVSLHKNASGKVFGKAFGVKRVSASGALSHFEQGLEGQFTSNETIKADVTTSFSGRETNRILNVKLNGEDVELGDVSLKSGKCKVLINDFLERDIKRRRQAEMAAKIVI